jgi:hypothetical protein
MLVVKVESVSAPLTTILPLCVAGDAGGSCWANKGKLLNSTAPSNTSNRRTSCSFVDIQITSMAHIIAQLSPSCLLKDSELQKHREKQQ